MEHANEKSVELTTDELDVVTGGMATRPPTHIPPRNPFPWPTDPYPRLVG